MSFKVKEVFLSINSGDHSDNVYDINNSNTDVIVLVEEETESNKIESQKYIASFFTYQNIDTLVSEHQENGLFLNGTYFYAKNMLLIKDCSKSTVTKVIMDLIDDGSFKEVFLRL